MDVRMLVGTERGLWELSDGARTPVEALGESEVTALTRAGERMWALIGGRALFARDEGGTWEPGPSIEGPAATCLAPSPGGMLIGTERAGLLRLVNGQVSRVESFDRVEGREEWYTPWG